MTQIDALKTDEIQNYEIEHQEEVRLPLQASV